MLMYKTPGDSNCLKGNAEVRNPVSSSSQNRLLREKETPQWMAPVFSQGYNPEWSMSPYQLGEQNGVMEIIPIIWEYAALKGSFNNWIMEQSRSVISALSLIFSGFIRSEQALNVALTQIFSSFN